MSNELYSPAEKIGNLLAKTLKEDSHFYFFSPDETTSNKFDEIFEVEKRAWGSLEQKTWDLPESPNGRIVEMLSENVLFSVMTGHLMNGEKAMMGSYEAFFSIITAQLLQQIKFIKQAKQVSWRPALPAVNLLSTSTCWRQDHNGYTHQSPALISTLLSVPSGLANCIFPMDDAAAEATYEYMINSENVVNLTTFNKAPAPRFADKEFAENEIKNGGAAILSEYSDAEPDFVLAAAGDIAMREIIEAAKIIREDLPGVKLRIINIAALAYRGIGFCNNKLSREKFMELFTEHHPIIASFHGYPETLENILENYTERRRLRVHGYNEEGSTTTPFEMLRRNAASRYDIAMDVAGVLGRDKLIAKYQDILEENHRHAVNFGEDLIQ